MSRKRDTNWSRDEIVVLLDSIMEITKRRAVDRKRTNSKEVFEYAAKKMAEMGHSSRADKEKCRTKWKKMKEEFTHAKRAREGDSRYKEAPGIQPFFERMEQFIYGNFDNISPHSTIVRRSSSLTNNNNGASSGMCTSARLGMENGATNGTPSTIDNNDTSSSMIIKTNSSTEYSSTINSPSLASPSSTRQTARNTAYSSSGNSSTDNKSTTSVSTVNNNNNVATSSTRYSQTNHQHHQQQTNGEAVCLYATYNKPQNNDSIPTTGSGNETTHVQLNDHVDISYRVSTGCRQITIFGDHDVDIKFRGDCVTINKINVDYPATDT